MAVTENLLTGFNYGLYRIYPEFFACFSCVHLGIDIQCGKELVQRGGGSVHHECVVDSLVRNITILSFNMGVLLVNLGSHGEAGLLFMNGLGNKDAGVFRSEIKKKRAAVFHHRNELFIADPSGIEENVIAEVTDLINDLAGIIDTSVISAELDNCHTDRAFFFCFNRIFFSNQFADIVFIKAMFENAADRTESISCRFQIHRGGTCQYKSTVVDGFMIVSVKKNDISGSENRIQHDFVRCGSAVQYEVCFICIVYTCRMLLGSQSRTFMNQEITHSHVGVAEVSSENVFAEEIIENTSCRVFAEERATLMPRAVKLGISVFHIFFKIFEERRKYVFFIVGSGTFNLSGIEIMIRFIQVDDTVYMTDDVSQRTALSRYRSLGGTIFMTVMVMIGPLFLYVDNKPVAGRFLMLACICALLGLLCLQITCVWCKERVEVPERPQGEKLNYLHVLKEISHNKALLGVMFFSLTGMIGASVVNGLNTYLYKDFFGNVKIQAVSGMLSVLYAVLSFAITQPLANKFGKKEWCCMGAGFAAIVFGILFFFPVHNPVAFIVINGICYLGASGMQVLIWAMVNDAIDYHELQTGERNEGIVYSTYSFFRKLASAISGSLSSFVLGAIGYNVTAGAVQTAGVVNAIWKSYTGVYFLGYGIAVAILFFVYPLTKQKTAEMLTELKARRAAKESK